tara:strand:- start:5236 stop:7269 length:2034 start_codon:yes stop_codon:yes gene_type:complete
MAETFTALTEDELLSLVQDEIKGSIGYSDGDLSHERQQMLRYYHAELPERQSNGNSSYVSQDVYDGVEGLKALLLETFSAGTDVVQFAPQGPEDVEMARVCTSYTNYIIHRQNDGFSLYRDIVHDGLMARNGIAKVYWDQKIDTVEEEFNNLSADQLDTLMAQSDVDGLAQLDDSNGMLSGVLRRSTNNSQVRIEVIPPEEFIINPMSTSIDEGFVAHRRVMRKADLIAMGFDADLIEGIGSDEDPLGENYDETYYRHEQTGPQKLTPDEHHRQEQMKQVVVYESYVEADMEGDGEARLYKVMSAGNTMLDIEEVDRRPFIVFTPIPVPHSFHGENFAYKLMPTQNAKTALMRSILDHASVTTNPRYLVQKGALTNPRELLDNRLGGIVNVTRVDGVTPLMQNTLNPFVFQSMQQLEEDAENTSGVSKLSQGLNKDAVSKQNSAAMVENLVSLSQQRSKIIARNFANNFLKPLVLEVYRLAIENEQYEKIVEVAGNYVEIEPQAWKQRRDVEVSFKLGYGESEREAQKFQQLHAMLTQDPGMQQFYSPENRYAMVRQALLNAGIKDVDTFLTPPEQVPPPQPDPAAAMQQQIAMKQMELEERKVALQEQEAQMKLQLEQARLELEQKRAEVAMATAYSTEERKDFDSEIRADVAYEELQMAKQTPAEERTAVVSPNS